MTENFNYLSKVIFVTFVLFFLLMFVLPIPGTTSIKYSLTVAILLLGLWHKKFFTKELKNLIFSRSFIYIFLVLLIFIVYSLIHSFIVSIDMTWSLNELRTQIVYPSIYLFIGIFVALISTKDEVFSYKNLLLLVLSSFVLHNLIIDLYAFKYLFINGSLPSRYGGLMSSPTYANYVTNMSLGILFSELIYRVKKSKNFFNFSNKILYILLGISIFAALIETVRLGDITLVFMGFVTAIIYIHKNNRHSLKFNLLFSLILIFLLSAPLAYNIMTDIRWKRLVETIPVAINTSQENMHWRDPSLYPAPKVSSGSLAGNSNYMRIAWARQSIHHVKKNPLGIGFGRDAFGRVLEEKYPLRRDKKSYRGMSSHSGILDLALGLGLPGLFLWTGFLSLIIFKVSKTVFKEMSFLSLSTLLITSGFFARSVVDANIKDHMLIQFMIILGILFVGIAKSEYQDQENLSNPTE